MAMKKRVGRLEAILIMKAAREFREKQLLIAGVPELVTVPACIDPIIPTKKSFLTYVIDFFRNRGT